MGGEQSAAAGFAVKDVVTEAIDQVKHQNGIPEALSSCHTALVESDGVTWDGWSGDHP